MKHFLKIAEGIDTTPILADLMRADHLWNEHTARRDAMDSPHREMADIWVRHRPQSELDMPHRHAEKYVPAFYPSWALLPSIRPLLVGPHSLMAKLAAVQLGGVLITKIPAHGQIYPHVDDGTWHAKFFNTKVYVVLQGNEDCFNYAEDEVAIMRTGEAWIFNNQVIHSMHNMGRDDRISLIAAFRVEV